jgi:5-(carboxyamino)imidazole ribonucleotide mutase
MNKPLVGIIMGSDSDLPIMKEAAIALDELQVPYEMSVVSAHRTPERTSAYAQSAASRGLKVIIAGAGGAAHLAGVAAAMTPLPVIGVPVKSVSLSGLDSLLSMVQMPGGIPVATVAINGARNAGLLAAAIIATGDDALQQRIVVFKESMRASVEKKAARLESLGWAAYLEQKSS